MTRQALLAATAFAMIATPALAADRGRSEAAASETTATATAADGSSAATPKGERKTCKTFQNTASRMHPEKLCLTREGWKKFEAEQ